MDSNVREIQEMISTIRSESNGGVSAIENHAHSVDPGVEKANEAQRAFGHLRNACTEMRPLTQAALQSIASWKQATDCLHLAKTTVAAITTETDALTVWGANLQATGIDTRIQLLDKALAQWNSAGGQLLSFAQRMEQSTAAHAATPAMVHFDVLGRPVVGIEHNGAAGQYATRAKLDIEGNPLTITDERGNRPSANMFDMLGRTLYTSSCDAGARWTFTNVVGNPIRVWDSRDHVVRSVYDVLHRRTELRVRTGAAGLVYPRYDGGFFTTVFCPDSLRVASRLKEDGIFVVPVQGALRVGLCSVPERDIERLVNGFRKAIAG